MFLFDHTILIILRVAIPGRCISVSPQVSLSASAFGTPRAPTLRLRCLSKLHQYLHDRLHAQSNPERFFSCCQGAVLDQLVRFCGYDKGNPIVVFIQAFNRVWYLKLESALVPTTFQLCRVVARYSTPPGLYPTRASVTDVKRGSPKEVTIATSSVNPDAYQTCPRLELSEARQL
jgi:hypothetical protein